MAMSKQVWLRPKSEVGRTTLKFDVSPAVAFSLADLQKRLAEEAPEMHLDLDAALESTVKAVVRNVSVELDARSGKPPKPDQNERKNDAEGASRHDR